MTLREGTRYIYSSFCIFPSATCDKSVLGVFDSGTMSGGVRNLILALCLLLGRVCSGFVVEDTSLVNGLLNQHVTLPCSFIIPENWKDHNIHITWYKNFTDRLLDCSVEAALTPVCQEHSDSRFQLSWKFLGNADLDIYSLQESDEGQYQCWVIFQDAYQRRDTVLHVYSDTMIRREASPLQGFIGWQIVVLESTWNVLLLSGWPCALLLAGIFLSRKYYIPRKKNVIII